MTSRDHSFDEVLAQYARGEITSSELVEDGSLSQRMRRFMELVALVSLTEMGEFEAKARLAYLDGVNPDEMMEMLLELADNGVRAPQRAFDVVRELMARPA